MLEWFLCVRTGLSEWEDDRVLAAVLAASQQEYIDGLKKNTTRSSLESQ